MEHTYPGDFEALY